MSGWMLNYASLTLDSWGPENRVIMNQAKSQCIYQDATREKIEHGRPVFLGSWNQSFSSDVNLTTTFSWTYTVTTCDSVGVLMTYDDICNLRIDKQDDPLMT